LLALLTFIATFVALLRVSLILALLLLIVAPLLRCAGRLLCGRRRRSDQRGGAAQ
jgi:hypothetical protein